MSNADDKLVDEYLHGATPYSAHYRRIETTHVPADLDRVVLDEARKQSAQRKQINRQRWAPPLALAATAVLTLSIVMRSNLESTRSLAVEQSPALKQSPIVAPAAEQKQRKDASDVADHLAAAPKPSAAVDEALSNMKATPEIGSVDKAGPPPGQLVSPVRKTEELQAALPTDSPQLARTTAEKKTMSAQAASAPAASPPRAAEESLTTVQEAVATQQQKASKETVNATQNFERRANVVGYARAKESGKQAGAEPEAAAARGALVRDVREADSAATAKQESLRRDPEAWLKFIRELRRANRPTEADEQWKQFVGAYPNYVVSQTDAARPR
jgi:hypothetical protein